MPEIIVAADADSGPVVVLTINGEDRSKLANVPFTPSEAELAALRQSNYANDIRPVTGPTPLVMADFKNGEYLINGEGKTREETWVVDTVYVEFQPSDIVSGQGLTATLSRDPGLVLSGEAYAFVNAAEAVVMVIDYVLDTLAPETEIIGVAGEWGDLPSYNAAWGWTAQNYPPNFAVGAGVYDFNNHSAYAQSSTGGALVGSHRMACYLGSETLAASSDGSTVAQTVTPQANTAKNNFGVYGFLAGTGSSSKAVIEKVTIYSASDYGITDLPALSAPTSLIMSDFQNGIYEINGEESTLAGTWVSEPVYGSTYEPSDVVPGEGLQEAPLSAVLSSSTTGAKLTPEAYALLEQDDVVVVLDYSFEGPTPATTSHGVNVEYTDLPGNADSWGLSIYHRADNLSGFGAAVYDYDSVLVNGPRGTGNALIGDHRVAIRLAADGLAMSFDGAASIVGGAPQANLLRNLFVMNVTVTNGVAKSIIRKITIYRGSTYRAADLPALSATT